MSESGGRGPAQPDRQQQEARAQRQPGPDSEPGWGPSLVIMYTLIALALVVAIGFALVIVLPFYLHRH